MRENEMSVETYEEKDKLFKDKLGITEEDLQVFYRVQKYFYIIDAFCWCSDNDYPCSDELAEEMAEYVEHHHDSTLSHWGNFEAAYNACVEPDTEPDDDMQFAGDIYGYDDVDYDIYGGESLD